MNILERGGAVYDGQEIRDINSELLFELSTEVLSLRGENSGDFTQIFSSEELSQMENNIPFKGFHSLLGEGNSAVLSIRDADETSILAELFPSRRRMFVEFSNCTQFTRIEIKNKGKPKIEVEMGAQRGHIIRTDKRDLLPDEEVVLAEILHEVIKKSKETT